MNNKLEVMDLGEFMMRARNGPVSAHVKCFPDFSEYETIISYDGGNVSLKLLRDSKTITSYVRGLTGMLIEIVIDDKNRSLHEISETYGANSVKMVLESLYLPSIASMLLAQFRIDERPFVKFQSIASMFYSMLGPEHTEHPTIVELLLNQQFVHIIVLPFIGLNTSRTANIYKRLAEHPNFPKELKITILQCP